MLNEMRARLPEMVKLLGTIVGMESPSTHKQSIDVLINFLADEVKVRRGKAEIISLPQRGNHLRAEWGEGPVQLLILCHADTVWDKGTISARPFRAEGDRAFGPGVYDTKAGIVQTLFAVDYLIRHGWPKGRKVVALFNSDEETGSHSSRAIIETEAKKSEAVFIIEPSDPLCGALKTSRKGVGRFRMKVNGRAAHAGDPQKGASAILELARQVVWLHGLCDFELGTTINVGVVSGGARSNVVAPAAEALIDLRVATHQEGMRIVPILLGVKSMTQGVSVSVEGGLERPPMERTEATTSLYRLAEKVSAELGIKISESGSGGGSDGNFTAALGVPTLDGLGAVGDGAHAEHEYLEIPRMAERTALLIRLLQDAGKK